MHIEALRVPLERIAVIIGKGGSTKGKIEEKTSTELEIDSETGEVSVGSKKDDAVAVHRSLNVVKAIARGFSPEKAFRVLREGYYLEILDLKELIGKSEKLMISKRGRVIGRRGKAREEIEETTGAAISVYGKTISIIGMEEEIKKARNSIEMLLDGASHSTVYGMLHKEETGKFEL